MTLNTLEPAQRAAAAKIGYNLFDLWEDAELINALPAGSKAMIWTGDATCDGFTQSIERFREIVRDLADNKKVFGYYLADEPEVSRCPEVGSQIKQRAEYIRRHAPGHKSFVATLDSEFSRLTPAKIGVDYFGIDPYPCRIGAGCAAGLIGRTVTKAAEAGIPRARMIPTFQTFGQDCSSGERAWRMPTPAELRRMLKEWDRALPDAPFDVSYTWGRQEGTSCPGLGDRPSLQEVMKEHIN